ncbi:PAS domain-containing sensor histidine kinase [Halorubrum sp. JWXQ-INN 858]|uniref:histidine kinase N-terminal 7TM domain-containing protein n=1 Tax=Halorubrum sp. JWXQ-INN 858 TaxID=2690782 RepID=UPI0013FCA9DB|nr:histidine kinase N-terminal 7TM domain-containing protein [Halorubrum sp. JWXQ-INN 858]MWV64778.1 PAS domain-containing sensor histidine kinase [Halorubrum sp. JWXQ-INN 858]
MVSLTPLTVALLVVITTGTTAAILAWRERPEAGATWLTLLLVGQVWWTVFLVFELESTTLAAKVWWYDVQWIGVVVIPVAWLLFALEYTGRNRYVTPPVVAGLSIVPVLTVVLAITGLGDGFLIVGMSLIETPLGPFLVTDPGPWYFVIAGYTYLLGLVGSVPLLQLVRDDARPFRGQSAALLVGTAAPWVSSVIYVLGWLPVPGLDPTPFAFAVSGVAYLLALSRFRLLTISPAPRRQARQLVFEYLHAPVFVLDSEGYVVDLNESAVTTFGLDRHATVGQLARNAVPAYEEFADGGDGDASNGDRGTTNGGANAGYVSVVGASGRRPYDVTVQDVTNVHHRSVGRVIVFHDVGEYLSQQQRLEVLNRVFRHNIRTETNLINGYVDRLATDPEDGKALSIVRNSANRIHDLSERTRSASDMFDAGSETLVPTELGQLLTTAVERAREEHPDATVSVAGDVPEVQVPSVIDVVLENLLSNAVRHNDGPAPSAWLSATADDGWVEIAVADDGCGIDEAEHAVLERGTETPLEHGSGIGLWVVKWGVDLAGGRVSFDDRDPTGTVVTVRVPTAGQSNA